MQYSTIQQHQPLRVPQSFDKQGRALIVQLDEIFDDIYRRFGRLKTTDLGKELQNLILIKGENGAYTSVSSALGQIQTDIQDELGNYYTKSETATEIASKITTALGDYSTTEQTADAIALAVGNCYGKVSSITIDTNGVTIEGGKYIKLQSGGSTIQIDPTQINMNTSGLVSILGQGNSVIELDGDQTIFRADSSGIVQAYKVTAEQIDVATLNVTNLNVAGNIIAELGLPNIVIDANTPTGHNIIWLEPNSTVPTPFSTTKNVNNTTQANWSRVGSTYSWTQTVPLESVIAAQGANKLKITGNLYKNGSTTAQQTTLSAVVNLANGATYDMGIVGTFPSGQSLRWNYGFSHEIDITAVSAETNISSITFTYSTSTTDHTANTTTTNTVRLTASGTRGTAGNTDECTVHYIA